MKLLVVVPLCDYQPATTKVWYRRATHAIVRHTLESFSRNVHTPLDLCILADRCTDRFVEIAQTALARFEPRLIDNSTVRPVLRGRGLPEKTQHLVNQLLRCFELAEGHDLVYFCEQDYLFREAALDHVVAAFREIPEVTVLTPYDHPRYHDPRKQAPPERYYETSLSSWKPVSWTSGNFLWRMEFVRREWGWLQPLVEEGGLDLGITRALAARGELMLAPVRSLVQHFRLDGSYRSPTFGPSWRLSLVAPIGRTIRQGQRVGGLLRRLAARGAG